MGGMLSTPKGLEGHGPTVTRQKMRPRGRTSGVWATVQRGRWCPGHQATDNACPGKGRSEERHMALVRATELQTMLIRAREPRTALVRVTVPWTERSGPPRHGRSDVAQRATSKLPSSGGDHLRGTGARTWTHVHHRHVCHAKFGNTRATALFLLITCNSAK